MTCWQQTETFSDEVSEVVKRTTSQPFNFYVPGIGDLALVKSKDKPNIAEIVLKKDGAPPDAYSTIIFDTINCQVRIIEKEYHPTTRDRIREIFHRILRSLLKVLVISLGCAYSFGFVSTVIDLTLCAFLKVENMHHRALAFRLVYGFVWGYSSGALLRPACNQAKTMLGPMLNRLGRASTYEVLRAGYMPYFWAEDLPEFLGFMVSTPICEFLRVHLGLMKGAIRSMVGMGIGAILCELTKLLSSAWRECTDADVVRDELTLRLRAPSVDEDKGRESERHHDASMGIVIGLSVVIGLFFWMLIERAMGKGLAADMLGSTETLAVMMVFYKMNCRCMRGEPSAFVCRELRALAAKRHKNSSTEQFVLQSDIDNLKKCASCSRRDIGSTFSDDLTGCL